MSLTIANPEDASEQDFAQEETLASLPVGNIRPAWPLGKYDLGGAPDSGLGGGADLPVDGLPESLAEDSESSPLSLAVDNLPEPIPEEDPRDMYVMYDRAPEAIKKMFKYSPEGVQQFLRAQPPMQREEFESYIMGGMDRASRLVLEMPEQRQAVEEMAYQTGMSSNMVRWLQQNNPQALNDILTNKKVLREAGPDSYMAQRLMEADGAEKLRRDAAILARIEASMLSLSGTTLQQAGYDLRVGFGQVGVFAGKGMRGLSQWAVDIAEAAGNENERDVQRFRNARNFWDEAVKNKEVAWLGPEIQTGRPVADWVRSSIFRGTPFLAGSVALAAVAGPAGAAATIAGGMGLETYGSLRADGVSPLLSAAAAGGTAVTSYFMNRFQLDRYTRNLLGRSPFGVFSAGAAVEGAEELLSEAGESIGQTFFESGARLIGASGYTRAQWWLDMKEGMSGAFQEGTAAGFLSLATRMFGLPAAVRNQAKVYTSHRSFLEITQKVGETELYKKGQDAILSDTLNQSARYHGGAGIMFASVLDLQQGGLARAEIARPVAEGGLGVSEAEYNYARDNNVDLAVPIGNVAVFTKRQADAGNTLFQDIFRADPDAMTGREIFAQEREMTAVLEQAEANFKVMGETEEGEIPDRIKIFRAALRTAGFDANESDAASSLFWARAQRAAELWGETPEAWLDRNDVQIEMENVFKDRRALANYEKLVNDYRARRDQGSPVHMSETQPLSADAEDGQASRNAVADSIIPMEGAAQSEVLTQPAIGDGDNQAWLDEATQNVMRESGLEGEEFAPLSGQIRDALERGIADPDVRTMAEQLGIVLPAGTESRSAVEANNLPPEMANYRKRAVERSGAESSFIVRDTVEARQRLAALESMEPILVENALTGTNDVVALRKTAEPVYAALRPTVNRNDGKRLSFSRQGFKKIRSHSADPRIMQAVPSLPLIFENAIPLYSDAPIEPVLATKQGRSPTDSEAVAWHTYAAKIRLQGEEALIRLTAWETREGELNLEFHDINYSDASTKKKSDPDTPTSQETNLDSRDADRSSKDTIQHWIDSVKSTTTETLYQEPAINPRGTIKFPQYVDAPTVIRIFRKADISTVIHELNHLFVRDLENMVAAGRGGERARADLAALTAYAGGKLDRAGYEKIAQSWERYAMDGVAPSPELYNAFETFRQYVSRVYQNARQNPEVEPSSQVRAVFDRWLATDDQIAAARELDNATGYWEDVAIKDSVRRMRIKEKRATAEAAKQRGMDVGQGGGRALRYFRGVDFDATRARIRGEAANTPIYRAVGAAKLAGGFDRGEVERRIGKPGADEIAKRHGDDVYGEEEFGGYAETERVAAASGFESVQEMLAAMAGAPNIEQEVSNRLEAELNVRDEEDRTREEQEGGLAEDDGADAEAESLAEQVEESMREQGAGERAFREWRLKYQAMRTAAARLVGGMDLREAKDIRRFEKAKRDAQKAALAAAKKNNLAKVTENLNLALLHHLTIREAMKARALDERIKRLYSSRALLDTLQGKKSRVEEGEEPADEFKSKVENSYAESIKAVATFMGFTKNRRLRPQTNGETIPFPTYEAGSNVSDFLPDMAGSVESWLLNKIYPEDYQDYRDFTVNQLREADRVLTMLIKQGRGELTALREQEARNLDELVEKSIEPMGRRDPRPGIDNDDRNRFGRILNKLNQYFVSLTCPEYWFMAMDGNPTIRGEEAGINQRVFWKMRDCQLVKDRLYKDLMVRMEPHFAIMEEAKAEIEKRFGNKLFVIPGLDVPDIIKKGRNHATWDADLLLSIAFMMGNDAALYRLTGIRKDGTVDARPDCYNFTAEDLRLIAGQFTADQWRSIQAVWDGLDSLYPKLDEVTFRITNRHVVKERAQALTVETADGQILALKGGYFPLVNDPLLNVRSAKLREGSNIEDAIQQGVMDNIHQSAKTAAGMTKARLRDEEGNPVVRLPQLLQTSLLIQHLDATTHYISHAETILEFDRLTRNDTWRGEFVDKFGHEKYRAIRNWVQDLARPNRINNEPGAHLLESLRNLATINALGLRPTTAAKQQLGLFQAAAFMSDASRTGASGWKYLKKGWREVGWGGLLGQKTDKMRWVDEQSERKVGGIDISYMSARDGSHNREINAAIERISPLNQEWNIPLIDRTMNKKDVHNGMFAMIQASDRLAAYTVWIGAYEQAMAGDANFDINSPGITDMKRHEMAVRYADSAAATQASSFAADLTAAQKSIGIMRFVSMFMSGNIRQGSRLMQYIDAYRLGDATKRDITSLVFREFVAPAMAWTLVRAALVGGVSAALGIDSDDDDLFTEAAWEVVETTAAPFPVFREIPSILRYNAKGDVPALSSPAKAINRGIRGVKRAAEGEYLDATADIGDFAGFWLGIPAMNLLNQGRSLTDMTGITERKRR